MPAPYSYLTKPGLRLLFVAVLYLLTGSATPAQDRPCATHTGPFMGRDGFHFCAGDEPVLLYGASLYPFWEHSGIRYRAKGWLREDFKPYIDMILDRAQAARLNTLRVTNYLDDSYFWDYNIVWGNVDYLVDQAAARGLWVILDLSTYRHWLEKKRVPNAYDPEQWRLFLQFVGQRYRDAPAIAHYSLLGEIPDSKNTGLNPEDYVEFYRQALEILHDADGGNHLISAGGLAYLDYDSGIPWEAVYSLPHNDIAAIHIYSDGDRTTTLPRVFTWARNNRVPLLIEEFGFQQDMGDAQRAAAFQAMFDLLRAYAASGMLFWNLGPEVAPVSYDVNSETPLVWEVILQNAP